MPTSALALLYDDSHGISILTRHSRIPRDAASEFLDASEEEREAMRARYADEAEQRRARLRLVPPVEDEPKRRPSHPPREHRAFKIDASQWKYIRELTSLGLSRRAIARRLNVSRKTIDTALARETPWVKIDDRQKRRTKRLESNLRSWATDGQVICIGRDVPPEQWTNIMKNPVGDAERAARTDFIFFLRQCRRCSVKTIAGMLGIPEADVTGALTSRGVKL